MRKTILVGSVFCLGAIVLTLEAADVWNKDYKEWTSSDVQRVLTNSPWAAKTSALMAAENNGGYGSQNSGGYPNGGGNPNGGGYPNSGGYPSGGGYPGGGGMGRGGIGFPGAGGGGYPGGGRGRRGGEAQQQHEEVIVRWDSSTPVREALLKEQNPSNMPGPGDPNYTLDKLEKNYVISVVGLHMQSSSRYNSGDSNGDDTDTQKNASEHMRNVLMSSTQLLVKNKEALAPDDVKVTEASDGTETAQFLFPKTTPIDLDDKEVTFQTQTGRMKIERKFKLKEMMYEGKLSL